MGDFEQFWAREDDLGEKNPYVKASLKWAAYIGWMGHKILTDNQEPYGWISHDHVFKKDTFDKLPLQSNQPGRFTHTKVYTHAPDSAARIAEQDSEIARLTKELEEARKALQFYADGDHYRRILPWLQEDNWRESLKKSGWVHLSTERDDEEYWVEGGQIADAAISKIGGAE